ncbi:BatD family protein [Vibrio sp. 10N]|uniref:BatD family protein n=1 Tax=Vibrio sp. 10N TaxID=3058938 RepID=UPI0028145B64|nr:BatD family protein [Vibrio sp. 10N]
MKPKHLCINAAIAVLSITTSFTAMALNVTASVTKTNVSKDEVIQLKVVADEKLDGSKVTFDALGDDFFMGRPSFSSSVNILNGTRRDSSVWTIAIAPQRLGRLTIPSFDVDGVTTAPITLTVTMDDQTPTADELIEVRTQLGKAELYPKESTTLDARIIVKVDPRMLQNPSLSDPIASGVDISPIGEPKQYQAVLDGVEVLIVDQSYRVTAKRSGDFSIVAPTLRGGVLYSNQRSGSTKILSLDAKAPEVALSVLPIPENYNGIWLPTPSLTASQTWTLDNGELVNSDSLSLQTGDALTRTLSVTAQGVSAEQMPELTIRNPNAFRVYPEKPSFTDNGNGSITMTLKQVLIAKSPQTVTLPSVEIQWWNTLDKRAATTTLNGLEIEIKPGEQSAAIPPSTLSSTGEPVVINDAGMWPWLTALFAALWLAFVGLWVREKRKSAKREAPARETVSSQKMALIAAVKTGDAIAAHTLFEQWSKQERFSPESVSVVKKELTAMSESALGLHSTEWDNRSLLKQIESMKVETKLDESLAKL